MAGDLEIVAKVFGTKELVAGLDAFGRQVRFRLYGGLKGLAREYAADVVSSGLAEQGIKSRTGLLARSMRVTGKLSDAAARVLVYPNASDPKRKYRYPWALGKGSPKNEVMVRAHFRGVPAGARGPTARARNSRRRVLYSEPAARALVKAGATQVAQHTRKIKMKPRPFMSGSALARLQSSFSARMERMVAEAIRDAQKVTQAPTEFDGAGVS